MSMRFGRKAALSGARGCLVLGAGRGAAAAFGSGGRLVQSDRMPLQRRLSRAIKEEVSQRLPPMPCTSA